MYNEGNTTICCKFPQLHSYQILLKLVNIWLSYGKNKKGELFLKHSVVERCCIGDRQMLRVCSPGGSTFLHEMTSWPASWKKCGVISEIWLRQLMHIYLKNNPAKFHPYPTWNDTASGFFEDSRPNKRNKKKNKMRSVPNLKKEQIRKSTCNCKEKKVTNLEFLILELSCTTGQN